MATNNFKAFGIGTGANVTTQADYEALAALLTGFQSGKASSAQINKALRQSSTMAYVLAQFISDSASVDVLDNGTPATIVASLKAAMTKLTPGRLLNVQFITSSGTYTPTSGTKSIIVECIGGGGGGGGCVAASNSAHLVSGGGGAGGTAKSFLTQLASSYAINIGSAGAAGSTAGTAGGNGGTTSFGSVCSASGGIGGGPGGNGAISSNNTVVATGGNAGVGLVGNLCLGSYESASASIAAFASNIGSGGASTPYGSGGARVGISQQGSVAGNNASGFGAGGSGCASYGASAATAAVAGGTGSQGLVIVWEYA